MQPRGQPLRLPRAITIAPRPATRTRRLAAVLLSQRRLLRPPPERLRLRATTIVQRLAMRTRLLVVGRPLLPAQLPLVPLLPLALLLRRSGRPAPEPTLPARKVPPQNAGTTPIAILLPIQVRARIMAVSLSGIDFGALRLGGSEAIPQSIRQMRSIEYHIHIRLFAN